MEKIVPPMTGAGMQYLRKRGDLPLQKSAKKKDCHSGSQRLIHIECDSHSLLPFINNIPDDYNRF